MAPLDRNIPTNIATLRSKQGTPSREFLAITYLGVSEQMANK